MTERLIGTKTPFKITIQIAIIIATIFLTIGGYRVAIQNVQSGLKTESKQIAENKKDIKEHEKSITTLQTKFEFIQEDIRDIKSGINELVKNSRRATR